MACYELLELLNIELPVGVIAIMQRGEIQIFALTDGGALAYHPRFLDQITADELFGLLIRDVPWRQETTLFGRLVPRLTAWYGDAGVVYRYSGIEHQPLPWTPELQDVRRRVEGVAEAKFNGLLLNRYRDGNDSVGWHADDEPELGENPIVPSISLGAVRRFVLKHNKTKEKMTFDLEHGSLLLMAGTLQHHWKHALPKTKEKVGERINLTFRELRR